MAGLNEACYAPIIRTRAAELKGYANLKRKHKDKIIPIIEFTRSRRSKTNPDGAVSLSVEAVEAALDARPFIADVTSLEAQTNAEVSGLLDPSEGFDKWTKFVDSSLPKNAIPVAHLLEPFDKQNFSAQVSALLKLRTRVAVRIPTSYSGSEVCLKAISDHASSADKTFIVVADAGYVKPSGAVGAKSALETLCLLADKYGAEIIIPAASSFPGSVLAPEYGDDEEGQFELIEVELSNHVRALNTKARVLSGDYATVHPLEFKGTVTAWVPRVDSPMENFLFYYRYRRHLGGYVLAAKRVVSDPRYSEIDCWGCENISLAARGVPAGKSPAHWIAVRVNIHMTRQGSRARR